MTYNKYTSTNLATGTLLAGISASATTLILSTGQGDLFPTTFPFEVKVKQFDTNTPPRVVKQEITKCTNRVGDTLTVVRSYEACPSAYNSLTQTTTAFAFNALDTVELVATAGMFDDIQDEVTRLETDKLNVTGGNWKVLYRNGSGTATELALPTAGKVLTGNGTTSAPTFETPTVDINGLTEDTAPEITDYTITYDVSTSTNKKIKLNKIVLFGGNGTDGAIGAGNVTITGSNNTYIVKNYTTFAPGANTVTVTPTGCVVHIRVQGDCDLTGTTFSFSGKGGQGGVATNGDSANAVDRILVGGGTSGGGVAYFGAGATNAIIPTLTHAVPGGRSMIVGPGSGGGGDTTNSGAPGGHGGGCVILEVAGNLTYSGTTGTFAGTAGANGASQHGGSGGGGGGSFLAIYNGTLTGTFTPTVSGGAGGEYGGGSGVTYPGGGGGSIVTNGQSGQFSGVGGAGGDGAYLTIKNTLFK